MRLGDEAPSDSVVQGAFNRGGFGHRRRGRRAKWWIDIDILHFVVVKLIYSPLIVVFHPFAFLFYILIMRTFVCFLPLNI